MRQVINTAPKNQDFIIIEDGLGSSDTARWSSEAGQWVGRDGEPSKITPAHWRPISVDGFAPEDAPSMLDDDVNVLNLLIGNPVVTEGSAPAPDEEVTAAPRSRRIRTKYVLSCIAAFLVIVAMAASFYPDFRSGQEAGQFARSVLGSVSAFLSRVPRPDYNRGIESARESAPSGSPTDQVSPSGAGLRVASSNEQLKQPIETTGAVSPNAGNLELEREAADAVQLLKRERERAEALTQDLKSANQASTLSETQYRQSVDQLRVRNDALTSQLASVREELASKETALNNTIGELEQVKQSLQAETAKQKQLESDGAVSVHDLSSARKELEAKDEALRETNNEISGLKDAIKKASLETQEARDSLQQSRDSNATLKSDLAAAHQEIEEKVELLSKAREESSQFRNVAEAKATELNQSLQQERDKSTALAHDLAVAQHVAALPVIPTRPANEQTAKVQAAAASSTIAPPEALASRGNGEIARQIAHATALLAQGNIGAARGFLERAVDVGSPDASFALAETYDPRVLARWGTYGTRGDLSKARELYEKAAAGGIEEARKRLKSLGR